MREKNISDKSAIAWALGVTSAVVLLCLIFFPVRYETNDDFGIIRGLSLQGGFEPDDLSPVLSKTLASLLYVLYKISPGFPWFGSILYGAIFMGLFWVSTVVIRLRNVPGAIICAPSVFFYFYHAFVLVNFTTAALILQLGAFLAILEWIVTDQCPVKKSSFYAMSLTVCVIVGYMLRWELALYFMALSLPIFVFVKKNQLKMLLPYIAILAVFIAADRTAFHIFNSPEDKEYMVYNEHRRVFHDTLEGDFFPERTPAALNTAGWTIDDYIAYKSWMVYDDNLFNVKTLSMFLSDNAPRTSASFVRLLPERLSQSYRKSKNYTIPFVFSFLALLLAAAADMKNMPLKELRKRFIATGAIFSVIVFFGYYRFEPRIYVPLYIYFLGLVLLLVPKKAVPGDRHGFASTLKWSACLIAAILTLIGYYKIHDGVVAMDRLLEASYREKRYFVDCLNKVKEARKTADTIIITMDPTDSLGVQNIHPLKEFSDYADVKMMPAGTGVNSPKYKNILRKIGVSGGREFLGWTIDNGNVLFALVVRDVKQQKRIVSMWESYYKRHIVSGKPAGFIPEYDFRGKSGNGLVLYRMTSYTP